MSDKVIRKFVYLSELAIKVNTYTDYDVFIDFSGHVNHMNIHYYKNGYKSTENNRVDLFNIYANHDSEKYILEVFEKAEKKLIALMKKEPL